MRIFLLVIIFLAAIVVGVAQFIPNVFPLPIVIGSVVIGATAVVLGIAPTVMQRIEDRRARALLPTEPSWTTHLEGKLKAFERDLHEYVTLAGEVEIKPRIDLLSAEHNAATQGYDDILEVVKNYVQVVIIGAPGAGKSTAMKRLFVAVAKARLYKEYDPLLVDTYVPKINIGSGDLIDYPLWIDLGYSENEPDALMLLEQHWRLQNLPGNAEQALRDNRVWLFLDGLNELPEQKVNRTQRVESIRVLLAKYPNVSVTVTCREADYQKPSENRIQRQNIDGNSLFDSKFLLGDLPVLRVTPLDTARIKSFCWNRLHSKSYDFLYVLERFSTLRDLATNPYMLMLLVTTYQESPNFLTELIIAKDTDRLNILYDRFFDVTYKDYFGKRVIRLPAEQLRQKMRTLAYEMIVRGKGTVAERRWATRKVGRVSVNDGINLNLLQEDLQAGTRIIRFTHQTLHTFFSSPVLLKALKVKRNNPRRQYQIIDAIRDLREAGAPAIPSLVAAAKADDSETIAGSCISALADIGAPAVPTLISLLDEEDLRLDAAFWLGPVGRNAVQAVPFLVIALKDKDDSLRSIAALALGMIGSACEDRVSDEIVRALKIALEDPNDDVRASTKISLDKILVAKHREFIDAIATEDVDKRNYLIASFSALEYALRQGKMTDDLQQIIDDLDEEKKTYLVAAIMDRNKAENDALADTLRSFIDFMQEQAKSKPD